MWGAWWRYLACFRHEDPVEADTKRAIEESLIDKEDLIRRREREEAEEIEINRVKKESLKLAEREEEERRNRNREFEKKCKRKKLDEQLKHSKDDVGKEDVNGSPHSICNGCKSAIEDGISLDAFGALWHPQCFCCLHCHNPIAESEMLKKNQQTKHSKDDVEKEEEVNGAPSSICNGCKSAIEDGRSLDVFGALWHFQCFCCLHCHKPIAEKREILNSPKGKSHRACNKVHRRPKCYVCEKKIPSTEEGIKYNEHPFWKEKYCPCHEDDGTAKCCSCERLESCGTKYVMLGDGRWLCRECMECASMDTTECHLLHLEIRQFFEDLNMNVKKEFPVFLVEREALNKAEEEEKIGNQYGVVTRGICLSEEQNVTKVTKRPRMGPDKQQLIGMITESQRVVRECEVTAVLILYGLPRFLTGSILAHEMMHAYLRLNGYRNLNEVLEEGLCQMLSHMWLEPQRYKAIDPAEAADSSVASSSRCPPPAATTSKKGDQSAFEKKLVEFYIYQIETDESIIYGRGFKMVNQMMVSNGYNNPKDILRKIQRRG